MKTYTFSQIIEILKPGQRAKCLSLPHQQDIERSALGGIRYVETNHYVCLDEDNLRGEWRLLPQYVTFEEALAAYKDGKSIRYESQHGNWFVYTPNNPQYEVSLQKIIHGKWSIVEEDAE